MDLKVPEYIAKKEASGVELYEKDGKIGYKAQKGSLLNEDLEFIKDKKQEFLFYLVKDRMSIKDILKKQKKEKSENEGEKFGLTDIQQAYLTGRNNIDFGGLSCQIFLELKYDQVDTKRCRDVWRKLIERHEMLRASITSDGYQMIRKNVPEFKIKENDLRNLDDDTRNEKLAQIRKSGGSKKFDIENDYAFDVQVTKLPEFDYMQLTIEFIIADWASIWLLLSEYEQMYYNECESAKPLDVTFRDYKLAWDEYTDSIAYEKDRLYWMEKLDEMPSAPRIPILKNALNGAKEFERYSFNITTSKYDKFKERASKYGVTTTVALITAYAEVLKKWSETPDFLLNLTVLNRMDAHEQIMDIVGDFTSTDLLEVRLKSDKGFSENATEIGKRLFEDMEHRLFSGVEVIREYTKRKGPANSLMPYVFTSAVGLTTTSIKGEISDGCISSTPQVFIDCQAMDGDFGLNINWDVRKGVFEKEHISSMFACFEKLVNELADDIDVWESSNAVKIPSEHLSIISEVNDTKKELPKHLLHEKIIEKCAQIPEKTACIQGAESCTYGEIAAYSSAVFIRLNQLGIKPGDLIAVVMPKSIYQIYAVMGILNAQGVYVPIDGSGAKKRRDEIIENCGIKAVITLSDQECDYGSDINVIFADKLKPAEKNVLYPKGDPEKPAYIIHTSGSTGKPKGVVINHRGAVNTIEDINNRLSITSKDVAIGLSNLWFDLSVYDIFGILSEGGTLCFPEIERYTDPSEWHEIVKRHSVTVWNSVPAFMKMYVAYIAGLDKEERILPSNVMLSGDWIGLNLFEDIKKIDRNIRCISMGGATEASIWSIFYEYGEMKEDWNSIPYGKPLANQGFKILDDNGKEVPVFARGELYITGEGLALGYFGNDEATKKAFVTDPTTNERMYKTGDFGRYMSDGNIEFLGRKDFQIKISGYRVELGEIQTAINELREVKDSMIVALTEKDDEKKLYALIVPSEFKASEDKALEQKIANDIRDSLPKYMMPKRIFFTEKMPLSSNGKGDMKKAEEMLKELNNKSVNKAATVEHEAEADDIQKKINSIWAEALAIEKIDCARDLYELGAESLIMGNVAGLISKAFDEKIPFNEILVQMLNYPTTKEIADFIRGKVNEQ